VLADLVSLAVLGVGIAGYLAIRFGWQ
jgi:hypothetical protein